jgi:hypothetical protein
MQGITAPDLDKVFWAGNIDQLADPVRSTRWRFCVDQDIFQAIGIDPTNGDSFGKDFESRKNFTIHIVGGPKIPDVKTKRENISYMGFKKWYPTQQDGLDGTVELTGLLLEDGKAYETILAWNQCCLNTGILNSDGKGDTNAASNRIADGKNAIELGLGQQENHTNPTAILLRNQNVTLELYDWMYGEVIMAIRYINAWPAEVKVDGNLSYNEAKLMQFKFTLQYDRWNIWFPGGYHSKV